MIHFVHGQDDKANQDLIRQMFRLRSNAFFERRKWSVQVTSIGERDWFDALNPLYIIVADGARKVQASLRLLPTTGPHMLSDVFPQVMGDDDIIRDPLIWESSRFCVDTKSERGAAFLHNATAELLAGLCIASQKAGLKFVVTVYDVFMERIIRKSGAPFERLGTPVEIEGLKTVAGLFEITKESTAAAREKYHVDDQHIDMTGLENINQSQYSIVGE